MPREFARVSSGAVILSLWVDGSFLVRREQRGLSRKERETEVFEHSRYVIRREDIEAEFAAAGLAVIGYLEHQKYGEKWRVSVLWVTKSD